MSELDNDTSLEKVSIDDDMPIAGFVFSNGDVVDINKGFATPATKGKKKSKADTNTIDTDEDDWGEQYSSGRVYRPTLNLKNLKNFSMDNLYHTKCIKQKSLDAFSGWDIVTVDRKGTPVTSEDSKRSTKDNKLYDFFDGCVKMSDLENLAQMISIDFNTIGFSMIEMTRNKAGLPARFNHMVPETCRIARNLNLAELGDTDMKYVVQVVNTHERIFKIFDGEKPTVKEPTTKNPMTEVLFITNYHVMGGKYGLPDWVPALKAMIGNDKVADYNINFFNNEAVPRFAVLIQGGKVDEDTKNMIKNYFKKELKGVQNAHKTLVLTSPKGAEIKLVPLAVEMKDGGFRYYRKDNRDEIISAHAVPPHRIQVYDSGTSGTLSPSSLFEMDKAYKYSVIVPLQKKIAWMFNQVIKYGFKIKDKQIKFADLDIGEEKQNAEIMKIISSAHEKYYNIGAMVIDEIREDLKRKKFNDESSDYDEDVKTFAKTPKPVYLLQKQKEQEQAALLNTSDQVGNGINEVPNENDDKSKEQLGKDPFNNKEVKQLMMKTKNDVTSVVAKVDEVISKLNEVVEKVEEVHHE